MKEQTPLQALKFQADLEIGEVGEEAKSAPFTIVARSGESLNHFYWGDVVHDMQGMSHKQRIPIDFNHDPNEIVGYANHFDTSSGDLVIRGALTPYKDKDRAAEIISKHQQGVPWEASINFGGDGIKIERLKEGETETINGRQFSGPKTIIRTWPLRGVAVTPYGQDANTSVALSQDAKVTVEFIEKEPTQMSQDTTENVEAQAVDTQTVNDSAQAAAKDTKPVAAAVDAQPLELSQAPGKRYMDAFGDEKGALYFAKGVAFEDAMVMELQRLRELTVEQGNKIDSQATAGQDGALEFSDATTKAEDGKDADGKLTKIPVRLQG